MRVQNQKDIYLSQLCAPQFHGPQGLLEQATQNAINLNKFHMCISAADGATLAWLIRSQKLSSFVEVGSLTGYSGLWILNALPSNGHFLTCEIEPVHCQKTEEVFALMKKQKPTATYEILEGDARETLSKVKGKKYDGIFIDANKPAYVDYLNWAEENIRQGGIIAVDNAFLNGAVYDKEVHTQFSEKNLELMRSVNSRLMNPEKYDSAMLAGGDGLLVATKKF